uniref:Ionotropic glutamate receptor C-terminal domain-containing protein n=1 Tax=Strigamia maritima TaxID=126957 RepID=T1JJT9_STRMM
MEALFYVAVICYIVVAFCREDIGMQCSIFLKTLKWSNVIILTDDQNFVYLSKLLSQHLISVRVATVTNFNFNELNNFRSVLIISKPNIAIGIVRKGLKLSYCPSNWLLILEKKVEEFGNFFIPHDIALFLLDVRHSHEKWFFFRLYSANGNVIKRLKDGSWNWKNGALIFSLLSVPLPSYSEIPFRLTTTTFNPFFSLHKVDGRLTIVGLHGEILKTIQSVFFFNASVTVPDDKLFGAVVNDTYVSGMVGKIYRNESDMGISITKTTDRIKLISYSPDITKAYVKLLYHHKLGAQERFFFYLEPFSYYSWICIIGFTVLFAVLLSIISFTKNKAQRWPKKAISNLKIIYYYSRSALHVLLHTGISIPVHVYGLSGRICLLVFHIFSIVMFINYCSSLTSILAVTRLKLPFNSFHEFINTSKYDLATLKGTRIQFLYQTKSVGFLFLQQSKDDLYSKSYKKLSSNPEKFLVRSNKEGKDLLYNQKIAYLMEELTMAALARYDCSFRFLDEVVIETDFCFTFNKQFQYKQLFNKYIQILLENGVNQKLYTDYKREGHNAYCDRIQREIAAIKIPAVVGVFFTLCLGIGIALLVFIAEILYKICF